MNMGDLLTISQAWAAAEAEHHAPSIGQIWFPLANFLIFAWILKRFALPLVRDYLRTRRQEVVTTLDAAGENKRRAAALVDDYRRRLAAFDQDAAAIQAEIRGEGERERAKLLQEAETLARKIGEDARFLADQEVKVARQKIRAEIADQAEASARELIRRNVTADDQTRLSGEFIREIGQGR